MGNLLLRILLVLVAIVLIVSVIGSVLPRDYDTSANIKIDATPEQIFPFVNNLRFWSRWTSWNAHDIKGLDVEYAGPDSGVGAIQTWSDPRGKGKLWITDSIENQSINFQSDFGSFPTMSSCIDLQTSDDGTMVRWQSQGSLPSGPFYGWFAMTFSNALRAEYNSNLERLKQLVESQRENNQALGPPGE